MALAQAVRTRRNELGLSQERFAVAAGVSATVVKRTERGIGVPDVLTLAAFERELGLELGTLYRAVVQDQAA